ncbi:MAG: DUF3127 domain-containing protein [Bacteroidales bacterium]|nr:DUF3127 domain-containing protein [Bacteroidales bacterium]
MALELEGRIARKLNVQTGTSARGTWSKQEFILEYQEGNFPTQVCLNVWGDDKVRELDKYQVGDKVKISFNLSSREYNGRWYTDVRAWRIEPAGAAAPAQTQTPGYNSAPATDSYPAPAAAPMPSADDMSSPLEDDDLPF